MAEYLFFEDVIITQMLDIILVQQPIQYQDNFLALSKSIFILLEDFSILI